MARKTKRSSSAINWEKLANTSVGRMNAGKIAAVLSQSGKGKDNKYGAIKVIHDGIKFDSTGEGLRYLFLKSCIRQGRIKDLRLQVSYELTPKMKNKAGKTVQASKYIADFVYFNIKEGCEVVEDFKGKRTQHYADKAKQMLKVHGIEIYETGAKHNKDQVL